MNIFEALRESHENQRNLSEQLIQTHGLTEERKELFDAAQTDEIEYLIEVNPAEFNNPKATHTVWSWHPTEKKWVSGVHHFNS